MRKCKECNSKMLIRLSTNEPNINHYFWGCSAYPSCRNIEKTWLLHKDFKSYNEGTEAANSMLVIRPNDIPTDADRHHAICENFKYDHEFQEKDIKNLDMLLGFDTKTDFYFWVATQQSIVNHRVHTFFLLVVHTFLLFEIFQTPSTVQRTI